MCRNVTLRDLELLESLNHQLQTYYEKKRDLEAEAQSLTRQLSLAPKGGQQHDKLTDYLIRIEELQDKYEDLVIEAEEKKTIVMEAIKSLSGRHADVIQYRYVQGLKWAAISKKMHYSENHCQKIRAEAIKMIIGNDGR